MGWTRISITGFILHLMNVPVCWQSKAQHGVILSSIEAEYVAKSEVVKEIRFIYYLLEDIVIEVELPILVKTENVGAMFMAQNASSGVRTCHVDNRYHFVRENLEEGIIKIQFAKSVENNSDMLTKNITQEIYERDTFGVICCRVGSTVTDCFGIGRVLEISLKFMLFRFSLLGKSIRDKDKLSDQVTQQYGDNFS